MSKEATLTKKSGKPEVLLYRTFLKVCMATAVLSVFIRGFHSPSVSATWFSVSVIAGFAYSLTYYLYKLNTDRDRRKHYLKFQCVMLTRFLVFLGGSGVLFFGGWLISQRILWSIPVCVIGLLMCQMIFNNKKIFSFLSTFFENMVAGCLVCAAYHALVIKKGISATMFVLLGGVFVCLILQAVFFYFYMNGKHKNELRKKKSDAIKREEAIKRAAEIREQMAEITEDDKDVFELAFEKRLARQLEAEKNGTEYLEQNDDDRSNADTTAASEKSKSASSALAALTAKNKSEPQTREAELSEKDELRMKNRQVIRARLSELGRDSLVVCSLISLCVLLATSGLIQRFNAGTAYDRANTLIPLVISLISVTVLLYNNFIKKAKPPKISYLHKRDREGFKRMLRERFGDNCGGALAAYDFVSENMNKKNGYTRWYNGDDYYVHPQGVAEILLENTRISQEGIIVALYHDCKEDLRKETRELFWKTLESYDLGTPSARARIKKDIDLLSKNPNLDYSDSAIMGGYLQGILSSETATLVKIADRMNNNSSFYGARSEQKAMRYSETRRIYEPFISQARVNFKDEGMFFSKAQEFFAQEID